MRKDNSRMRSILVHHESDSKGSAATWEVNANESSQLFTHTQCFLFPVSLFELGECTNNIKIIYKKRKMGCRGFQQSYFPPVAHEQIN